MDKKNNLTLRKSYSEFCWDVEKVFLDVNILDKNVVSTINLEVKKKQYAKNHQFKLNGEHLKLISIYIDDKKLSKDKYFCNNKHLIIKKVPKKFNLKIKSVINPATNTSLEGLYLSNDMICTQCEPEGFRKIAFFPDRPDVMSVFKVRIEGNLKFKYLLSNGNLIEEGKLDNNRHFAVWHAPFPKPSYLFALVAGDLEMVEDNFITKSGKNVILKIYVEKGNSHLVKYAM